MAKLTSKQRKAVFAKLGIAKIEGERNVFQVSSLSDPTQQSYIIDVHDPRLHKRDCLGFRFAKKGILCRFNFLIKLFLSYWNLL